MTQATSRYCHISTPTAELRENGGSAHEGRDRVAKGATSKSGPNAANNSARSLIQIGATASLYSSRRAQTHGDDVTAVLSSPASQQLFSQ